MDKIVLLIAKSVRDFFVYKQYNECKNNMLGFSSFDALKTIEQVINRLPNNIEQYNLISEVDEQEYICYSFQKGILYIHTVKWKIDKEGCYYSIVNDYTISE